MRIQTIARRLEPDEIAAEQTFEQFAPPGTYLQIPPVRPRNVPEGGDGTAPQMLSNQPGREREVVVLHEDDGTGRRGLGAHGLDEAAIHHSIRVVVARAKTAHVAGDKVP